MVLASRGREPTDSENISLSNPEGVTFALPVGIGCRPDAERSIYAANRKLGMSPRWGWVVVVYAFDRGFTPTAIECHPFGV